MRDIAGYEIVRKLGSGGRSEVYLGHLPHGVTGAPEAVAVKVLGRSAVASGIDVEIDALAAAGSEHVVALVDVATFSVGGCALILERLPEGSLSRLLRVRPQLAAGEAVTIVASLVRGLGDLHSSGFAHGHLTGGTVLFDAVGRPVLIGLGHATRLRHRPGRGGKRGHDALVLEDYRRLADLAQSVFDRVDSAHRSDQLHDFVTACSAVAEGRSAPDPEPLEELAFAIAQPAPVRLRFTESAAAAPSPEPLRMPGAARGSLGTVPEHRGDKEHRGSQSLPSRVMAALVDGRPLRILRERMVARVRSKKRQVWFAGALSSALLVAAIALLPTGGTSRAGPIGPTQSPQPSATPSPTPSPTRPSNSAADTDDPVAAVLGLLRMRDDCLRSHALACLDDVDQADSAIHDADRRAIANGSATADPAGSGIYDPGRFSGFAASLIQRTGNSALVALAVQPAATGAPAEAEPASAFLVKGESGWRLRQIFAMQPQP